MTVLFRDKATGRVVRVKVQQGRRTVEATVQQAARIAARRIGSGLKLVRWY